MSWPHIHVYVFCTVACTLNSRLLSGHLGVVAGTLRGYFLPVRYGSVGVQLTRLRALYQGTLTSGCVWKNLNTSYLYNAAILASFFFIRVFKGVLSSEFVDYNRNKTKQKTNDNQQKTRLSARNLLLCLLQPQENTEYESKKINTLGMYSHKVTCCKVLIIIFHSFCLQCYHIPRTSTSNECTSLKSLSKCRFLNIVWHSWRVDSTT